jgi:hypothetical protein
MGCNMRPSCLGGQPLRAALLAAGTALIMDFGLLYLLACWLSSI